MTSSALSPIRAAEMAAAHRKFFGAPLREWTTEEMAVLATAKRPRYGVIRLGWDGASSWVAGETCGVWRVVVSRDPEVPVGTEVRPSGRMDCHWAAGTAGARTPLLPWADRCGTAP